MSTTTFGVRAGRRWTAMYTRSLPPELAQRRRAEIDSDLHEHAADGGVGLAFQLEVLGRVLSGVPADLSWRRAVHRSHLRPQGGTFSMSRFSRYADTALVVVVAIGIAIPATSIGFLGSGSVVAFFVIPGLMMAVALFFGLKLRSTQPTKSTVLLVVGAPAPAACWFWLPPVYLVSVLIIVLALATAPRAKAAVANS